MLTNTCLPVLDFAARCSAGGTTLRPRRFAPHGAVRETERDFPC